MLSPVWKYDMIIWFYRDELMRQMLYQYLYKPTEVCILIVSHLLGLQGNAAGCAVCVVQFIWICKRRDQFTVKHTNKGWYAEIVNLQ